MRALTRLVAFTLAIGAATTAVSAIGANSAGSAPDFFVGLITDRPEVAALEQARARYASIAEAGGWRRVPANVRLEPGDALEPGVAAVLTARLAATGDLSPATMPDAPAVTYDGVLVDAVRVFQARHGLEVDGVVGPRTVAAMNVPVEARMAEIEANIARWRERPLWLGERYVAVNVPEFRLRLVEHGVETLAMNVVVGAPRTPTPIFGHQISYLVFRPHWYVPSSIVRGELMPKAANDPTFLVKQGYEVLDPGGGAPLDPMEMDWSAPPAVRIRQQPGPGNALGLVKFMFPNEYSVYLHDTPSKSVFGRARRALSHGCVRVADPVALATALLGRQGWARADVEGAMHGSQRTVTLDEPVPVYLEYFTSWVDDAGQVQFREDIYGLLDS